MAPLEDDNWRGFSSEKSIFDLILMMIFMRALLKISFCEWGCNHKSSAPLFANFRIEDAWLIEGSSHMHFPNHSTITL